MRVPLTHDRSLLTRALVANVVSVSVSVLVLTALFLFSQRMALETQLSLRAESLAGSLAGRAEFPMLVGNVDSLQQMAGNSLLGEDVLLVAFTDAFGHFLAGHQRPGFNHVGGAARDPRVVMRRAAGRRYLDVIATVEAPSSGGIAEWEGGPSHNGHLGSVHVAFSLEKEDALFAQTLRSAVLVAVPGLALILTVQFLNLKRIFLPLKDLINFTEAVGGGNLSLRAPVVQLDETGKLAAAFNRMLDQMSVTTVSENYVDRVLQSMAESLLVADAAGLIRTVNRTTCESLGYRREELLGRHVSTIVGNLEIRDHTVAEHTYRAKDGRLIPVLLSISTLQLDGGDGDGMVLVAQDITERKKVQEELLAAKEAAEASNRAKSAFLANISHELRTPLNAIIGYSEMLTEDAEVSGQKSVVKDSGSITSAGRHLLSLINDVLDLSKIEAGRIEIHPEEFDIGSLLDQVVATTEPLAAKNVNQLVVRCEIRSQSMHTDLIKFRQCLLNLLSNACKFTQNGTITLEVRRHSMDDRHWLEWAVSDTGIGIPVDQRHKLFEAFSQVDNSTTRKHGGTGLGLAISHRLCELLGGRLLVESVAGRGSTFTLRMPADPADIGNQDRNFTSQTKRRPPRNPAQLLPENGSTESGGLAVAIHRLKGEVNHDPDPVG